MFMQKLYIFEKNGNNIISTYLGGIQMNQSGLKNMVVLRNLPSNIVEEAIVILKTNKKIIQNEKVDKSISNKEKKIVNIHKENDYILKEAEMLVTNYITGLEQKKKERNEIQKKINKKCKKLKKCIIIMSVVLFLETILLLIK